MPKAHSDIPHGLRRVYRRFQHWRNKHPQARLAIPKRLWFVEGRAEAKVWERGGTQGEGKLTDNMGYHWRVGMHFPTGREA